VILGIVIALAAWLAWQRWPARRGDVLALLALAAVLAIFFAPVLVGERWLPRGGGDLTSFLWPSYRFTCRELGAGRLPLWNPHLHGGRPFIADNQSAVFYPPNLALCALSPGVSYEALQWLVILHFWLAGAGMYVCLRMLRPLSPMPALFGGVAFMLSDVFVTHQGNLNLIAVAAYLPLVFLCAWRAMISPGRERHYWAAGAGALLGVATLAGHAQMTLFLVLAIGAVSLSALAMRPRAWRRTAALTALAAVAGGGIAAVTLLPSLELTPHTLRASISYEDAAAYSLPPKALVGLVAPWVYGRGPDNFTGDWDRVEVGYAGAVALLLALYGAWRARREPLARFLVIFGALALLLALGEHTPLHRAVYQLPLMNSLRAPARFVLLFDFALAGLAAMGVASAPVPDKRCLAAGRALTAILAAELIINGAGVETDANSPYTGYEHAAVVDWLQAQPGVFRVEGAAPGSWQPDAAAYHGLYDIYGLHNPLALADYESFYWSAGQRGSPVWRYLGARYVIRPKGDPPAGEPFAADFAPVFDDDPALTVYEDARARPLAHVVGQSVSFDEAAGAWDLVHAPGWDPTEVVYVEGGVALPGELAPGSSVEIAVYEPGRLVYRVTTTAPAGAQPSTAKARPFTKQTWHFVRSTSRRPASTRSN
jgi:hypothetical protein